MFRNWIARMFLIGSFLLIIGCGNNDDVKNEDALTETGTSMGGASVIRSAQLVVSGHVDGRMEAPMNTSSLLTGNCDPEMFANFGIQFSPPGYTWVQVAIMSQGPIKPGQTGPVRLEWVAVNLVDEEKGSLFFKGPGTFEISLHNAVAEDRRMTGIIKGTDLEGSVDAGGQKLNAEFAFDINFSCGVE